MWTQWHCTHTELLLAGQWNVKLFASPILTKVKRISTCFFQAMELEMHCNFIVMCYGMVST